MLNNVHLPPTPLVAQGFSSKTVPSLGNATEALFESVLFHTHHKHCFKSSMKKKLLIESFTVKYILRVFHNLDALR